jgi:pimeloyl-ACP methyl ester carboxylesterase
METVVQAEPKAGESRKAEKPDHGVQGWIAALAVVALVAGVILSRCVEPGVRVEKMTLAGDTPVLHVESASPGPHPVALLAHGVTASKETLFCVAEALARAGFNCFAVDLPGHGESKRLFSPRENASVLTAVAREVGPVDVFVGHSMGAGAGAQSVFDGGLSPRLFIALGAVPRFDATRPQLLLLEGEFDEAIAGHLSRNGGAAFPLSAKDFSRFGSPAAQVVIVPWCDHATEPYDPRVVGAAVEAACQSVDRMPPARAPSRWFWRLVGLILAVPSGVVGLMWLVKRFPRFASGRGFIFGAGMIAVLALTTNTWVQMVPNLRRVPFQLAAIGLTWLILSVAGKLRIPRWSFGALGAGVATLYLLRGSYFLALLAGIGAMGLAGGAMVGIPATRGGKRGDGDIAMAIFMGYAFGQWLPIIF